MKFTPNLVIGVVLTLVGAVLILDRLGLAEFESALRLWPVLILIFGISVVLQSLRDPGSLDAAQTRPIVSPGLIMFVVVVAVLASRADRTSLTAATGEPSVSLVAVLGGDERSNDSQDFRGARMVSVMGGTKLDLRGASMGENREAVIHVVTVMGGAEILVPRGWDVDVRAARALGGIQDWRGRSPAAPVVATENVQKGTATPSADAPTTPEPSRPAGPRPKLIITGVVLMGGLEIKS